MDTDLQRYQDFLEWLIANPSLIDVRKIRDYAITSNTLEDALSFTKAVILKSTKKRAIRKTNIVRHNHNYRERFNA